MLPRPWRVLLGVLLLACNRQPGSDLGPDGSAGGAPGGARGWRTSSGTPCSKSAECGHGEHCTGHVEPACGGAMPAPRCRSDSECGRGLVCTVTGRCGEVACAPPCTGCSPDACNDAGHCAGGPHLCATDADCPDNYACTRLGPQSPKECAFKPCTRDDECRGFCVDGWCNAEHGRCTLPVLPMP